jgi:hypothetical protein
MRRPAGQTLLALDHKRKEYILEVLNSQSKD